MKYHIFIKMSLNPEWIIRFKEFWKSIDDLGFASNDGKITVNSEDDAQRIADIASEYKIEVKLVKQ